MDVYELARASNACGASLFTHLQGLQINGPGDATFLSPWGIFHVLAMLLEGAAPGSPSYQQIHNALLPGSTLGNSLDAARIAVKALSSSLTSSGNAKDCTVVDACSCWVAPEQYLLDGYVGVLKLYFHAEARLLTSASLVNDWVNSATRGKISSIIEEATAQETGAILINAIYFADKWRKPFERYSTMRWPFNMLNGSQMGTQMMYTHQEYGTALQVAKFQAPVPRDASNSNNNEAGSNSINCVAVKMAYKAGTYSAVIAIPEGDLERHRKYGPPLTLKGGQDYSAALVACRQAITSGLNPESPKGNTRLQWQQIGSNDLEGIHLYLPRFEIEFEANLTDALKSAGLDSIFRSGDFTKMTAAGDMEIKQVVQKLYVKVDESGTEAAAVTAFFPQAACAPGPPPKELYVRFDRPFVFSIVHEASGLALFIGEVYKPEVWKEEDPRTKDGGSFQFMPLGKQHWAD